MINTTSSEQNSQRPKQIWTRLADCPICHRPGCKLAPDGAMVVCRHVEVGSVKAAQFGGWLHVHPDHRQPRRQTQRERTPLAQALKQFLQTEDQEAKPQPRTFHPEPREITPERERYLQSIANVWNRD